MKKTLILFITILFLASPVFSGNGKQIKKTIPVEKGASIYFEGISGGENLKISSWDKPEIKVDIEVYIDASDKDYEKEYIKYFDVVSEKSGSRLEISFKKTDKEHGFNFWDIFKLKFNYYQRTEVKGEIFLPSANQLTAEFRYSDVELTGMQEEVNIDGKGNLLAIKDCQNIQSIKNYYGPVSISNSKGGLNLENKSSDVTIEDFSGDIIIDAPYSNINIKDVDGRIRIDSKSAKIYAANTGDLDIDSYYSEIELSNSGSLSIKNKSGNIRAAGCGSFDIDAPYSGITIRNGGNGTLNRISGKSGNIELKDINGGATIRDYYSGMAISNIKGDIDISSKSSKIEVDSLEGNWTSDTRYSKILLSNCRADKIDIQNKSDVVKVDLLNNPSMIKIENVYGDIDVRLPEIVEGQVELTTKNGRIESDFPLKILSDGGEIKAHNTTASNGIYISANNRSGNIFLKVKN